MLFIVLLMIYFVNVFCLRERDDLLKTLASLRTSIADAKITEGDLRKDFQKSLSTVEEIQLQKNQVMVNFITVSVLVGTSVNIHAYIVTSIIQCNVLLG